MKQKFSEVEEFFKARGGIAIEPFVNFGRGEFEEPAKNRLAQHK